MLSFVVAYVSRFLPYDKTTMFPPVVYHLSTDGKKDIPSPLPSVNSVGKRCYFVPLHRFVLFPCFFHSPLFVSLVDHLTLPRLIISFFDNWRIWSWIILFCTWEENIFESLKYYCLVKSFILGNGFLSTINAITVQ